MIDKYKNRILEYNKGVAFFSVEATRISLSEKMLWFCKGGFLIRCVVSPPPQSQPQAKQRIFNFPAAEEFRLLGGRHRHGSLCAPALTSRAGLS